MEVGEVHLALLEAKVLSVRTFFANYVLHVWVTGLQGRPHVGRA